LLSEVSNPNERNSPAVEAMVVSDVPLARRIAMSSLDRKAPNEV
jgi:hypothetical protein